MDRIQNLKASGPLKQKLLGPGKIVLTVFRGLNIVTLTLLAVASWVLIVMFFIARKGQWQPWLIWDLASQFSISFIAIFLIVSEVADFVNPLRNHFANQWPVLSDEHGFLWFGTAVLMMGFNILSHLNSPLNQVSSIGLPQWQVCMAAGITAVVVGSLNMMLTGLYTAAGLKARAVRAGRSDTITTSTGRVISGPTLMSEKMSDIESEAGSSMPQRPADVHPAYMWRGAEPSEPGSRRSIDSEPRPNPRRYSPAAYSQFFGRGQENAREEMPPMPRTPPSGKYDVHPSMRQDNMI